LQRKQVHGLTIEALGPQMHVGLGVDQLGADADLIARPPDAAFQYIAHAELAADPLRINRLVSIGEGGIPRDHEHIRDPRQIGRQILGDAIREILLLRIVAQISERQHDNRQAWREDRLPDWREG
jgi:hypothetical protein